MADLGVTGSAATATDPVKPAGETPAGASRAPLPPLRWSSARDCTRKAILELGPADREPTDRERRILWRGRSLGQDYTKWLKAKYGPNAVWREVKVRWPLGTGHIDIFLRPTRTAIEVLSSAHASEAMVHSKLVQLVGYIEHYPRAHNGCLIVLDPSDFSEERFPVAKDTQAYRDLAEEVYDRIEQLAVWRNEGGRLPPRVCSKPSDAVGHFCRHADTCFAGWEPDPLPEVDRPEVVQQAALIRGLKDKERLARTDLMFYEGERKEQEKVLAELLHGQPLEVVAGPFRIRRTDVQRKPTLDVRKAELAGALNVEVLGEYMKPGAAYTTWRVDRHEGDPGDVDYGEEPF